MDVRSLRNGHEGQVLRHVVTTREGWTKSSFGRYGNMFFNFSTRGDSCAEYQAWVDARNGEIRARWQSYDPLGCGRHDDDGGYSNFYGELEWLLPRLLTANRPWPRRGVLIAAARHKLLGAREEPSR